LNKRRALACRTIACSSGVKGRAAKKLSAERTLELDEARRDVGQRQNRERSEAASVAARGYRSRQV
jgi:hypothetical protein